MEAIRVLQNDGNMVYVHTEPGASAMPVAHNQFQRIAQWVERVARRNAHDRHRRRDKHKGT